MQVILIAAQSLDGRITLHDAPGAGFASEADQRYFRETLAGFDCSIMGGGTFRVSEKSIRARKPGARLIAVMTRKEAGGTPGMLEFTDAPPEAVVEGLRARGKQKCALLGGGQIYSAFLAAGLVDEVWLTLEPRLFGRGVPLVSREMDVRLKLLSCEKLSADTLLLKYEVLK